ncbi:MarC family protein [Actinomyces sp. zg-332]|uniref:MarC family protein n=1 Tax=Actinomyces sp. zg-332 TaxID=2708340 RepID=UPI00296F7FB0
MEQIINVTLLGTTFATLFVIMDPPGAVPVFLALTGNYTHESRKKAAWQASVASFGIIIVFMLLGRYILKFLQISLASLQLSGGVVLFLMAMTLLTGMGEDSSSDSNAGGGTQIALVPMGTPMLAGPGAIVAVMVAVESSGQSVGDWVGIITAVVLMHIIIWITLRFSTFIARFIGEGGTLVLTKISGILLAAIATELIARAIFSYIYTQYGAGLPV